MLLKTPYLFTAKVLLARSRTHKEMTLRDSVDVKFAEAPAVEAPVALWWTPPEVSNELQMAIRWYDGALWHPLVMGSIEGESLENLDAYLRETGQPFSKQRAEGSYREQTPRPKIRLFTRSSFEEFVGAGLGDGSTISPIAASSNGSCGEGSDISGINFKEIDFSARDACRAQIARFAADTLLIDGVPHRRVPQPVIVIRYFSSYALDFGHGDDLAIGMPEEIRQINKFEDAVEALNRISGGAATDYLTPPEIVRPDLLDLADPLHSATCAVTERILLEGTLTDSEGESPLANHVPAVARAFVELRDAYLEGKQSVDLLAKLEVLVASIPAETPEYDSLLRATTHAPGLLDRANAQTPANRVSP